MKDIIQNVLNKLYIYIKSTFKFPLKTIYLIQFFFLNLSIIID